MFAHQVPRWGLCTSTHSAVSRTGFKQYLPTACVIRVLYFCLPFILRMSPATAQKQELRLPDGDWVQLSFVYGCSLSWAEDTHFQRCSQGLQLFWQALLFLPLWGDLEERQGASLLEHSLTPSEEEIQIIKTDKKDIGIESCVRVCLNGCLSVHSNALSAACSCNSAFMHC